MKKVFRIAMVAFVALLVSCNSEISLQEYFVTHKDDANFISVDLPTSLLGEKAIKFSEDQREALESIKKINFLGLRATDDNQLKIEEETAAITKVLDTNSYETLMSFGFDGAKVVLKYQGDDDDIDEVIIFGTDQDKGLALIRILGDNMNPAKVSKLIQSLEKENLDVFKQVAQVFE